MPQPESTDANDKPLIWIDGRMLPKSRATVSVYDHGLLYGDGIFEGIRVYRGKIFKSAQHMKRLWRSAERLRIDIPMTQEEMVAIQRTCINANEIVDGYIRLVVTRGVGNLGLNPFQCPKATVICIADTISLYPPELYEKGLKVIVAKRPRVPIECLDPRVKSLNYLNNIMAKVESLDLGLLESIMLNIDGYVAECTGDNIFIIKDGNLYTPPGTAGILEGITRNFVIDTLCPQLGLTCTKRNLRLEEVLAADEVFLTGSAAEIIAVTQIGDNVMGDGKEGPITKRLRGRFREIVTSDNVPED
jgi:branched-chain amino acid aminotransferase